MSTAAIAEKFLGGNMSELIRRRRSTRKVSSSSRSRRLSRRTGSTTYQRNNLYIYIYKCFRH
ncbi:hypothetical protein LINPERHAP1_LOCUS14672 [Linum perenne]